MCVFFFLMSENPFFMFSRVLEFCRNSMVFVANLCFPKQNKYYPKQKTHFPEANKTLPEAKTYFPEARSGAGLARVPLIARQLRKHQESIAKPLEQQSRLAELKHMLEMLNGLARHRSSLDSLGNLAKTQEHLGESRRSAQSSKTDM